MSQFEPQIEETLFNNLTHTAKAMGCSTGPTELCKAQLSPHPVFQDAPPAIRGRSPLQFAGYDVAHLPIPGLCVGLAILWLLTPLNHSASHDAHTKGTILLAHLVL